MKKQQKNDNPFCVCGHQQLTHNNGWGICGIWNQKLSDDPLADVVPHWCEQFQLDNLKYLETIYEEKTTEKSKRN